MKKRSLTALLCIMLAVPFFSGCGKDRNASSVSTSATEPETTTAVTETTSEEDTTEEKETTSESDEEWNGDQYSSNTMAAYIRMDSLDFFYGSEPLPKMIYGHIQDGSEFGNYFLSENKTVGTPDAEYLIFLDDNGLTETVICWICNYDKKYVGCSGKMESISEINADNWGEVLAHYGLKEGEYTYIYSNEDKKEEEIKELDLEDTDVGESCILASALAREAEYFFFGENAVCYGLRKKDEPFTDQIFEVPSHGDIEYVIVYDSMGKLYRVLCWDCDRDKRYVGDTDLGAFDDLAASGWDKVLEKYGFKEKEYTE